MRATRQTGSWAEVKTAGAAAGKYSRAVTRQWDAVMRHDDASARKAAAAQSLEAEVAALRARRLARAVTAPPDDTGEHPPLPYRPDVLLLEDDAQVSRITFMLLERAGFTVTVVQSGSEACAKLMRRPPPDVLVCDLLLGVGCSGIQVARECRLNYPGVRVVLWSGALDSAGLHDALVETGAHAAVAKSDGFEALALAVRGCHAPAEARAT